MSRGLNKCQIIGNVGKTPEMKYTPTGKAVTTFGVAVNNTFGTGDNKVTETEWFNCEAWGKAAETLNEYVKAGSKIYVEGRIKTDKWEKDGVPHSRTKLIVRDFMFLSSAQAVETGAEEEQEESFEFG